MVSFCFMLASYFFVTDRKIFRPAENRFSHLFYLFVILHTLRKGIYIHVYVIHRFVVVSYRIDSTKQICWQSISIGSNDIKIVSKCMSIVDRSLFCYSSGLSTNTHTYVSSFQLVKVKVFRLCVSVRLFFFPVFPFMMTFLVICNDASG